MLCVCVYVCACVELLTFVYTLDVKQGRRLYSVLSIRYSLSKRDQIAVPVSSRMAAVRVVNVCFFKGDAMKDFLFSFFHFRQLGQVKRVGVCVYVCVCLCKVNMV